MNSTLVSVIIVSYNVRSFLDLCLDSVFRALEGIPSEVFVVDNNSFDGSPEMVQSRYPTAHLIHNKQNTGFAKANNQAVALAQGAFIHYLNPDTVVPEDFYQKTLDFMLQHPDAGCLGPKLIDGKGFFAPDSKKAFPSFWTSVYKVTGLSKLFAHSSKFNRYYRLDLPEDKISEVEILSGSCLLVRKAAMEKAGGSFDEGYFMFCEDVDLCHRIGSSGFKNYYFPKVAIIHYKGESTRKLSLQYMKIFHEAHVRFVKKYYPKNAAAFYINALGAILAFRNLFYVGRHLFSLFKLFIFDAVLLTLASVLAENFWFNSVADVPSVGFLTLLPSLLYFLFCWLGCLFLNGAYDKPFSLFKAGRGMLIGTLFVLAGYALFPMDYRFSRAVVLLSGMTGFIFILFFRWLLGAFGWIRLVPRGKLDYKAAIISDENHYHQTLSVLKKRPYYATIIGRIKSENTFFNNDADTLGEVTHLRSIQKQFRIDELIFNAASLSYKDIIQWMQLCSKDTFFKIQASKSLKFIGSYTYKNNAELYFVNQNYVIDSPSAKRNKRIIDIGLSVCFMLLFPFIRYSINNQKGFWINIQSVFSGKKTWVGYAINRKNSGGLPKLRKPVLPPYKILENYQPDESNELRLADLYAKDYSPSDDLTIILTNLKYLGNS